MALFKKKKPVAPEEIDLESIDRESKYKIFSERGDKIIKVVLTLWALFGNVRVDCRSDEYEVVPGFSVPVPEGQGQHGTAWWMPRRDAGRVFGTARTSGAARLPADLAERYREERRSIYAAEKRE